MKRHFLLVLLALVTSCQQYSISENDYIGTWLVKRSDGYLEKLSIYPNHKAEFGGREYTEFTWDILSEELNLKYKNNNKIQILYFKLNGNRTEMHSTKNEWYQEEDLSFTADKKSSKPNAYFNLFEVATTSESSKIWECINVGSGGQVYAIVMETSFSPETCKSQCEARIKAWHSSGENMDEHCK